MQLHGVLSGRLRPCTLLTRQERSTGTTLFDVQSSLSRKRSCVLASWRIGSSFPKTLGEDFGEVEVQECILQFCRGPVLISIVYGGMHYCNIYAGV
jgi:hypothetical protein